MRKSQKLLIEKRMARGRFKRLYPNIPFDEVKISYADGYFIFEYDNEVIDKILI